MARSLPELHVDHVRRAQATYETFVRESGDRPAAPWDALPESTQTGWLKAAAMVASDALNAAADLAEQRGGTPAELSAFLRGQADDVTCHKLTWI